MGDAKGTVDVFRAQNAGAAVRIEMNECRRCHSRPGTLCRAKPSGQIAFYHKERLEDSGCYDRFRNLLPRDKWTQIGPNLNLYWDLKDIVEGKSDIVCDFEGMADAQKVLAILDTDEVSDALCGMYNLPYDFMRDMLLHWVYENLDQAGYEVSSEEAATYLHTLGHIFTSRYWIKVTESDLEAVRDGHPNV